MIAVLLVLGCATAHTLRGSAAADAVVASIEGAPEAKIPHDASAPPRRLAGKGKDGKGKGKEGKEGKAKGKAKAKGKGATPPPSVAPCDAGAVDLLDFEAWRREEGFWFGEYTFLGADGFPNVSPAWNYPYDQYWGFIHLQVIGNAIKQRNVFVYPPATAAMCEACTTAPYNATCRAVVGAGACGVTGNEKIFAADQSAVDCDGNLAGPFCNAFGCLDTATTLLGDDTVLYQVTIPDFIPGIGGAVFQNQLTTLPGNGIRVRTAQGFTFAQQPDYASFYRETKLPDQQAFVDKLYEIRALANVLPEDYCATDGSNLPSGVDCSQHFGFAV